MHSTKGLTLKDQNYINSYCKSIAKCERHGVKEKELRQQIYMLGLYTFRQYHHAGLPADIKHPGLNQQSRNTQTKQYEHLNKSPGLGKQLLDHSTKAILV